MSRVVIDDGAPGVFSGSRDLALDLDLDFTALELDDELDGFELDDELDGFELDVDLDTLD